MVTAQRSPVSESVDAELPSNETNEAVAIKESVFDENEKAFFKSLRESIHRSGEPQPMTKNQISIPVDGSMVGVVGSILVSAFFGITLWLGLLSHLKSQTPFRSPNRRNSVVHSLTDIVEEDIKHQSQELEFKQPGNYLHLEKNPPLQQEPYVYQNHFHNQHDELGMGSPPPKSHLKVPAKTMKGVATITLPEGATHQQLLASVPHQGLAPFGKKVKGHQSDKRVNLEDGNVRKHYDAFHLSVPPEMDYNSYQTRPFSLPGSFVNPDRKGYQNNDVTYYFEGPDPTSRFSHRIPVIAEEKDTTYYFETPPSFINNPGMVQAAIPVQHSSNSFIRAPSTNQRFPPRATRPFIHSTNGENHTVRPIAPENLRQANRSRNAFRSTNESSNYPPHGLLNLKPNKWRSSTKSHLSDIPPYTWNWRRVSEGYQRSSTKSPKYPERKTDINSELTGPYSDFQSTVSPKITSQELSTKQISTTTEAIETIPRQSSTADSSKPVGAFDYDDVITAFRLNNGVPVNWMPDAELTNEKDKSQVNEAEEN
ncbi:uncharacterized protein [Palaemon carinicauda]|uniref:uncharacterized protein n=1 Tax=Palaemon carinicauda TaxID=392227 RepID=UPI0035B5E486